MTTMQKFFLSPVTPDGSIIVRAAMQGEDSNGDEMIGDMWVEIGPKGDFCGTPFAELEKLGPGEHDLPVTDDLDDEPEED